MSLIALLGFLISSLLAVGASNNDRVIWQTSYGPISGYVLPTRNGTQTNIFKGIPFASPPVGRFRFQMPQPLTNWTEPLDATEYKAACMTNATVTKTVQKVISEDCLYLNVFADSRCRPEDPCPVLVLIHGGAFQGDSAVMFDDAAVIERYASDRFVFAIPAYRLGVFGFLDLGEEQDDAPYNVGMHDMIMALKWLRDEVHNIGGDAQQTTLIGYSSGATMIEYLMGSPAVPPTLFARSVLSSGVGRMTPHLSLRMSQAVRDRVGCSTANTTGYEDIPPQLECLREKPPRQLSDAMRATDKSWSNVGAASDNRLFPVASFAQMRQYWKARPVIILSTKTEMNELEERSALHVCDHVVRAFGYVQPATLAACVARYAPIPNFRHYFYRDFQHATNVMIAAWNSRAGAPTFVGLFAQLHHAYHTGDMYYMIGFHQNAETMTPSDRLMNDFFIRQMKRFFRGGDPGDGWEQSTSDGGGYYYLSFLIDDQTNKTTEKPEFRRNEVYNYEAVNFWLRELAEVERKNSAPTWGPFGFEESAKHRRSAGRRFSTVEIPEEYRNPDSSISLDPHLPKVWHPLNNTFLTAFALLSAIVVFAVVLMAGDFVRQECLKRQRYSPLPSEADALSNGQTTATSVCG